MALGKIKADTLEHSTAGSLDTSYVVNGSAKAWATHTQSGSYTLHDSFNISSITDGGAAGKTFYNWASNFSNAFYSATTGVGEFAVVFRNAPALGVTSNGGKTTGLIKWESQTTGNSGVDSADNNLTVHGDLA